MAAVLLLGVCSASALALQQPVQRRPVPPTAPPQPTIQAAAPPAPAVPAAPTESMLGLPIYPAAQFIASFDAGRGQRYYLFGSTISFTDMVTYYRSALKQKGELVFEAPATQMFEVCKFREDSMAFPPGVTVKDYTWGGSAGYLNPKPGAQPARFPTIIQLVTVPDSDR